ncbi:hypothetical protein HPB47_026453 [Ixodes persulcatus]|uniref:Uncharacterized protein n=1 Tax=Ixodes persulcatus TaxID=34615 RepID=A0AC60PZ72_IXOPE|nr:hypothetical protein HPB47_026453 [Ixodes persulcatus]
MKILQELDRGDLSKTEIAKKFDIPKSTLSRISKYKEKIQDAVKRGSFATDRRRMRKTPFEEIENVLFLWFKRARSANFPISGPILEEKAGEIASQLGIDDFKMSDGWLSHFKKRHGLVFKTISGESAAVNRDLCSNWQQGLPLPDCLSASTVHDTTATEANNHRLWCSVAKSRQNPSQATDFKCSHASANFVLLDYAEPTYCGITGVQTPAAVCGECASPLAPHRIVATNLVWSSAENIARGRAQRQRTLSKRFSVASCATAILEEVAKGVSKKEIADKYGLKKSMLTTLVTNKKRIKAQRKEHFDQERKRLRTLVHLNVEKAVLQWIHDHEKPKLAFQRTFHL